MSHLKFFTSLIQFSILTGGLCVKSAASQVQEADAGAPHRVLSVYEEFSHTSSHIIEGVSRRRKLEQIGMTYEMRLFNSRAVAVYYEIGINPITLIEDPIVTTTFSEPG